MKVLLCISGGIATYKICEVISLLKKIQQISNLKP